MGYLVTKRFVDNEMLKLFEMYALMYKDRGLYFQYDQSGLGHYADILSECLLLYIQPSIEKYVDLDLIPTYSYLRIYGHGDTLKAHVDRSACEISCSLVIGYKSEKLWPLFVKARGEDIPIELDQGDALIYKGCEIPHWRDQFKGEYWIQVFLHYVNAKGKKTAFRYDKRKKIGVPRIPGISRQMLNAIGVRVWTLIDQPHSVSELCDILTQEFDLEKKQVWFGVTTFLQLMISTNRVKFIKNHGQARKIS